MKEFIAGLVLTLVIGGIGIAIEMQEPPDAIHHDNFPSPILRAGDIYRHEIQWSFHTESQH